MSSARLVGLAAKALRHSPLLWRASRRNAGGVTERHIRAGVAWLLEAQRVSSGGGFAHSFHLLDGWQPPYPETTGYILPSLRRAGLRCDLPEAESSVAAAVRWLHDVQQPDGGFLDLEGRSQVFDTGQILGGLAELLQAAPGTVDSARLAAAGRWLMAEQEADGSFLRHAYNGIPHSYYARVGAALLTAGRVLGDGGMREAGRRNLRWTMAQQKANGFFGHLSFDSSPPFLHTMIYVVEGLLDGHAELGEPELLAAALRFTDRLLSVATTRDGLLRSQYWPDFSVANAELCLAGLAQWAGVCFRLAALGHESYRAEGRRSVEALKRRQMLDPDPRLFGGLAGSTPVWGRYLRFSIPNWSVKFLLDALLLAAEDEAVAADPTP